MVVLLFDFLSLLGQMVNIKNALDWRGALVNCGGVWCHCGATGTNFNEPLKCQDKELFNGFFIDSLFSVRFDKRVKLKTKVAFPSSRTYSPESLRVKVELRL